MVGKGINLTKRQDIQVLRGIAVSGVFLFHLLPDHFQSGYLGVDVFFVISGFLLTPAIERIFSNVGEQRIFLLKSFYFRRFFRLTPPLVVTVLLFSIWMLFFGPLADQRYVYIQGLTSLLNLANIEAFRLSQGNYFHPDPNALLHTWSLSAEEQVFVILPITLLALRKYLGCTFKASLLVSLSVGLFLYSLVNFTQLLAPIPLNLGSREFFYFSPLFRVSEFLIGSLLAVYLPKIQFPKYSKVLLGLSLCTIMVVPKQNQILLICTLCLTAAFIVDQKIINKKNFIILAAARLGDASYSVYLVHLPVIYIVNHIFINLEQNRWIISAASVLITFGLGGLSHSYIEGKLKFRLVELNGKRRIAAVAGFCLIPILIMGLLRFGSTNFYGLATPPSLVGTISCEQGEDIGYCGEVTEDRGQNYLLIGDSHAAALSEIFREKVLAFGGNPFVMYGRGCPLSITGFNPNGEELTPCQQYLKMVLDFTSKRETTLIIAQRSSQETWPDQQSTQDLLSIIQLLNKQTKKIYLITPNPEFRKGMAQGSLSSLLETNSRVPQQEILPASSADATLLSGGLRNSNVFIFDSTELFCENQSCVFKLDGKYLYWDSNHLSRDGAALYSEFFSSLSHDG